ncbi:hypothetical protein C440_05982 [Haloferax mucosum ATCC BAA-1512]|uniref:Uncharacterized protein n=1 Tax=Haloferax mucosum ATCC BAA-1512 TaxID=662479 RepID=M0IGA3_9EURY|nr:hypothetical protein C440_05982 [Haloferax mucosum ATCC BAA-1512]
MAGLYTATLVSPALLLVGIQWFSLGSDQLALGLLGATGGLLTAVVAWWVTGHGGIVAWFNSTWLAILIPAIGVLPIFAYFIDVVLYLGFSISTLQAETTAHLIGTAGFVLGMAASCLGGVLVYMARRRLVDATIDNGTVSSEWTAGWSRRDRFKLVVSTLITVVVLIGLSIWQLGSWGVITSAIGFVSVVGVSAFVSERTYRVTPAGLELRNESKWLASRRIIPWSQFEGFSVTGDSVVLHRRLPNIDVRFSRRGIATEEAVITDLEQHLHNRNHTTN